MFEAVPTYDGDDDNDDDVGRQPAQIADYNTGYSRAEGVKFFWWKFLKS